MYDREYEYIMAIAQTGTLSRAAVSLGISQPALTRFLQKEEQTINTKLFQKTGGRLTLTYAGECYINYIKKILSIQRDMMNSLQAISRVEKGRIRIGIPSIRRPYTIFSVIPEFIKAHPSIDITLHENRSSMLEQMLEDLELDVIAVNTFRKKDSLQYRKVADEEFVLAVPAGSPLITASEAVEGCKYPVIRPEQLNHQTFIFLSQQHRISQFTDKLLAAHHIEYKTAMHARTLESALEAVSVNMGITFTPEVPLTQLRNSENIRYLSVLTDDTHYEFNLVYRKGAYIDPSLEDFSRIFMENYQKVMPAAQNLYINTKWKIVPLQLHTHCREHRELVYMEHASGPRCLDLYLPEHLNRPAPVILNVSGGGWYFGHRNTVHIGSIADVGLLHGFAFVSMACVSTRMEKYPFQIREVKTAIRYLRSHAEEFGLDPDHIILWSPSSGAHLSLMAALTDGNPYFDDTSMGYDSVSAAVQAVVATYPPTELGVSEQQFLDTGITSPYPVSGINCTESILLGCTAEKDPALYREASPLYHITKSAPPLYLQHGRLDNIVPYIQSERFAEVYRRVVGPEKIVFESLEDAGHSDPRFKSPEACERICRFLENVLEL